MNGRWRSISYEPILWVKTNIEVGIGGFGATGGYLLRVQIPSLGDTIVAKKRYLGC